MVSDSASLELSIVIPTRSEPGLGEVVRQVLEAADAAGAIEVIVVGTGDWSDVPEDPRVIRIPLDRPTWPGLARNIGIERASGEMLVFLDADCFPLPGWLDAIRGSQVDQSRVCCGALVAPTDDFWQACYNLTCFREYLDGLPRSDRQFLASYCLWGPRQAFVECGGFLPSQSVAEDLELTIRMAKLGWPLRFEPSARVLHKPVARGFSRIIRRGLHHGGMSIQVRRRYPQSFSTGRWGTSPLFLFLLGPVVGFYFLLRTYLDHPALRHICRRGALVIYLFRVAWCIGAAWGALRPGIIFQPVANT